MKDRSYLNIVHYGPGNVGKKFIHYFFDNKSHLEKKYGHIIRYAARASLDGWLFNSKGMTLKSVLKGTPTPGALDTILSALEGNIVLVDTTASDKMSELYKDVLARGGWVVTSNKKNITASQKIYAKLVSSGRLLYETTVGAGLPIISTLQELIETGDTILEIQGCFSGTLGFIFSELDKGKKFSKIVNEVKEKGFTEPDPRDDLSGLDVARKSLILNRLLGKKCELTSVKVESLYPAHMQRLSIDDFMKKISNQDEKFSKKITSAHQKGYTYRYIATIAHTGCSVGIKKVSLTSDIGSLQGPDNIVVVKTKRYYNNPMVIKGPGAGLEVTGAGVLGDVTKILQRL